MASINDHSCFTELQENFDNLIPCFSWSFPEKNETWPESVRLSMEDCIPRIQYLFELATKDFECLYNEVHSEAKSLTTSPENYPQIMAQLLTDQKKRYYERFCDPSKPTLLFFYRFVRGYVYFVFIDRVSPYKRKSFALSLQTKDVKPFFMTGIKRKWRESYNSQIDKWAPVIPHLPSEIAEWAVKDEQEFPIPDNSSQRGFKINQPKLLIGVQI
jgi:hypothetical protein